MTRCSARLNIDGVREGERVGGHCGVDDPGLLRRAGHVAGQAHGQDSQGSQGSLGSQDSQSIQSRQSRQSRQGGRNRGIDDPGLLRRVGHVAGEAHGPSLLLHLAEDRSEQRRLPRPHLPVGPNPLS